MKKELIIGSLVVIFCLVASNEISNMKETSKKQIKQLKEEISHLKEEQKDIKKVSLYTITVLGEVIEWSNYYSFPDDDQYVPSTDFPSDEEVDEMYEY
jgi:hypothetical protein